MTLTIYFIYLFSVNRFQQKKSSVFVQNFFAVGFYYLLDDLLKFLDILMRDLSFSLLNFYVL